ncbi:MAG: topoisomerase DNA-binding C4 zinc finger domain-containing protein [Deltaproteobacteria bacterium]|nr:topoisomerase DNA-binding C4 zinc finger domain-containing protein [Deltaproteobacteria bacterium]
MEMRSPVSVVFKGVKLSDLPKCPQCGSEALYRYGKIRSGKNRFLCLSCNRQFVLNPSRKHDVPGPVCPKCGRKMHVYSRKVNAIRYRCANYPECRTFIKIPTKEKGRDGL